MKACVLYFSATGNTKKFANAISNELSLPIFNVEKIESQEIVNYDLIIIGTPVHGLAPAKIISSFVEKLPKVENKKAIIFSTYTIRKGSANEKLQKLLAKKGYITLFGTSKRGVRFGEQAFEDNIEKIKKIFKTQLEI